MKLQRMPKCQKNRGSGSRGGTAHCLEQLKSARPGEILYVVKSFMERAELDYVERMYAFQHIAPDHDMVSLVKVLEPLAAREIQVVLERISRFEMLSLVRELTEQRHTTLTQANKSIILVRSNPTDLRFIQPKLGYLTATQKKFADDKYNPY